MATAKGDVDIAVKLRGAREFASDSKRVSTSVDGIGNSVDRADRSVKDGRKGIDRLRTSMRTMGPVAAAAGAAVFTFGAVQAKKAVDTTLALAKSTMRLNRMTNLSTQENSRFAAVAKIRGIEDKQMGMMLTRLSTAMIGYQEGTAGARKALDFFGVSQDAIAKNDPAAVLVEIADGYANATDKARKNAYAQQLLGRSWQNIAPLISQGAKGLREELQLAGDLGAVFDPEDLKSTSAFIAAQRQAQYASLGLQIALGKKLIPTLAKGALSFTKFIGDWTKNRGTAGEIKQAFIDAGPAIINAAKALASILGFLGRISKQTGVAKAAFNVLFRNNIIVVFLEALRAVPAGIRDIGRSARRVANTIGSAFSAAAGAIKGAFRGAINFIIRGWNSLSFRIPGFDPPGPGPKFGGLTIRTPQIPELYKGGTITRSGWATVGERGPELLRLPAGAQVQPLPAGAGFGGTVVTKVYLDRRQIAQAIGSQVATQKARR